MKIEREPVRSRDLRRNSPCSRKHTPPAAVTPPERPEQATQRELPAGIRFPAAATDGGAAKLAPDGVDGVIE